MSLFSKAFQTLAIVLLLLTSQILFAKPMGEYIQPDNLFPKVKMTTSLGDLVIELDRMRAPITVNNFLSYVKEKRYDDTLFHRLEHEFVLQGGGYKSDFEPVKEFEPIFNESGNGVKNDLYTISMARQREPHSATSQFFFNLADNKSLNPGRNWGYTVFGTVVQGEEVFEKLLNIETGISEDLGWPNFPTPKISIKSVEILAEN